MAYSLVVNSQEYLIDGQKYPVICCQIPKRPRKANIPKRLPANLTIACHQKTVVASRAYMNPPFINHGFKLGFAHIWEHRIGVGV